MTSLMADDHLVTLLGSFMGHATAVSRIHPKVAERAERIGQMFDLSDFGPDKRLARMCRAVNTHFAKEKKVMSETNISYRMAPDNNLLGNYQVWVLFRKMLKHKVRILSKEKQVYMRTKATVENSILSCNYRAMEGGLGSNKLIEAMSKMVDQLSVMPSLEAVLYEKFKAARARFNTLYREWERSGFDPDETPICDFLASEDDHHLSALSFGPVMLIRVARTLIAMPEPHTHKLISLFKSWTNLTLVLPSTSLRYDPLSFAEDYLETIWNVVEEDVDFLGEVLKGARNVAISRLDKSKVIGVDMYASTLQTLSPARRSFAIPILNFMSSAFVEQVDAINMLNLYKAIPHPDTNLHVAFSNISGLHTPNTIDPEMIPRFRGTLRRAMYRSLATSSHDVRLIASNTAAMRLVEEANMTQRSIAQVCEKSALAWSHTTFEPVRTIMKPSDITLAPSDKSSQVAPEFSEEDLEDCVAWSRGEGSMRQPQFSKDAHTLNDAASYLKGGAEFNTKKAVERFEKVIRMHTAFEAKYPGLSPEEIPEEDLQEFVLNNPDARYLVGTEPKLGEYHKKVTRIFYMAEQELKIITQITERVARQVSRKQNGVSIVKGYSGRRKDLEHFAQAVTGSDAEKMSIFLSFDMAEFSKKFPMALVREYGEFLAEITGEDWLRRIDLVFRAAIVIHNSRGYFDWIGGVKGGFEGFLNFIWSSIHAVIMEISLKATGLSGAILTYSDDGLLLFYAPGRLNAADNMKKVVKIKDTYAKYGLVFHLGKTLVSSELWEYLGDICHNGHLLPMWMKEISSVGILKNSRGLSPLRMRVSSFEGQVASAVSSGCNPLAAYILMRFTVATYLANFLLSDDNRLLESLMIIPVALGGMRIRSPLELCLNSDIDVVAEFVADLDCLKSLDPTLARTIIYHLPSVVNGVKASASRIMMGNLVSSSLPDTSGMSVIMQAIDIIGHTVDPKVSGSIGSHPITTTIDNQLMSVLHCMNNIDHKSLSRLLMSLPPWIKFTKSMALVRGSGAIRLIPRKDLKALQAEDTKKCRESFAIWKGYVNSNESSKSRAYDVLSSMVAKVNGALHIAPMKKSARSLITAVSPRSHPAIEVRYSPGSSAYPAALSYIEPRINFPSDSTTLHWFSEATGDVDVSAARKFQGVCASFLSYSPEALPFLRYLGNLFSVDIPSLPAGLVRGFHRRSAQRNVSTDIRLVMPRAFWSLSSVNYVGEAFARIRTLPRGDRVTYLESCRVMAYFQSMKWSATGAAPSDRVQLFQYSTNVEEMALSCTKNEMRAVAIPEMPNPQGELTQRMVNEFNATITEHLNEAENYEVIDRMAWEQSENDIEDLTSILVICINNLSRWIHDIVMTRSEAIIPLRAMPIPPMMKTLVIKKAVTSAMWMSMEPRVKGLAGAALRKIIDRRMNVYMGAVEDIPIDMLNAVDRVDHQLRAIFHVLKDLEHDVLSVAELERAQSDMGDVMNVISECVFSNSVFSDDKLMVIRGTVAHAGQMTESHRVAFKKIFSASVTALTNAMYMSDWDAEIMPIIFGLGLDPDDVLDWLHVCRPLLRASTHRTIHHPYNRTSATIEMFKFYTMLKMLSNRRFDTIGDAELYATNNPITPYYQSAIRRILLRGRSTLGPDHAEMIKRPILAESMGRLMAHHRQALRGESYGTREDANPDVLVRWIQASLTAYYERIILRAIGQIIEVPSSFAAEIENMPMIQPFASAGLSGVTLGGEHISGTAIPHQLMVRALPVKQLLSAHIANFCIKSGLSGIAFADDTQAWLQSCVIESGYYSSEGPSLTSMDTHEVGAVAYVVRRFDDVDTAFATYITLARNGVTSMSLLRNPKDHKYYIVGVYNSRDLTGISSDYMALVIESDDNLDDYVSRISFEAEADLTMNSAMSLTRSSGISRGMGEFHTAISSYARHMNRPAEVNDTSFYLQAAADLARDAGTSAHKLWAYTLFLHYLNRDEHDDRALNTFNRLRAVLNRGERVQRARLLLDVSQLTTWLRYSSVFPGDNISFAHVTRLVNMAGDVGVNVAINQTISFQRVMTFHQITEMLSQTVDRFQPGTIMASLIVVETLAIMPADETEDETINAEDVDLDNFW